MEPAYSKGCLTSTEFTPSTGLAHSFMHSTVADEVQTRGTGKHCCKLELDFEETEVQVIGIALPTRDGHNRHVELIGLSTHCVDRKARID